MMYSALALAHFQTRRYQEALEAAQHSIESNARFSVPRAFLAATLVRLGRNEKYKAAAECVLVLQPSFTVRSFEVDRRT